MKINNRKEIAIAMYGFFLLIILDILFLIFAIQFLKISKMAIYGCFLVILVLALYNLIKLRNFSLEVSEHIFSVKYGHPLLKNLHPVLEVPIHKIISLKTEKGIIAYILIISVSTKRGIRNFYYKIGQLPENQFERFKEITDSVKDTHINNQNLVNNTY